VNKPAEIIPAHGKLGVLLVGLGAVSTTFIAGVEAIKKGLAQPVGSLTQMGTIRLGKRTEGRSPLVKDFVPLASLDDIVFGGWDIFDENCYEAARTAGVLEASLLEQVRPELERIRPWTAVFDRQYVKRLDGPNVKTGANKKDLAEQVRADIRTFKADHHLDRLVMIWCGSTEIFMTEAPSHQTLAALEQGLQRNDVAIPSSMVYAYAALMEGVPFANGAPNLTIDVPALMQLAHDQAAPVAGKDFKTGQTLIKTVVAPGLKARLLGITGWYSTNILGNRDGEVLDDPESFKTKEESKKSVLDYILQPNLYPQLYDNLCHVVRINYYPPRGDNKEGWDNIDLARLPDAAEDQLPVSRQHPGGAPRARPRAVPRPGEAVRPERHPGVALVLLQEPDACARPLPGARPLHPVDEAEEHAAVPQGRGPDHAPWAGVLRLRRDSLELGSGLELLDFSRVRPAK